MFNCSTMYGWNSQFAGKFDAENMKAFEELRSRDRTETGGDNKNEESVKWVFFLHVFLCLSLSTVVSHTCQIKMIYSYSAIYILLL